MTIEIKPSDDYAHLLDNPPVIQCPHCSAKAAAVPIAIPRHALIARFEPKQTGMVCRCSSCNGPIFLQFGVQRFANPAWLTDSFKVINRGLEPFETQYLAGAVLEDFNEARICYANSCWNAFAAMCRRCIQSIAESFGAEGSTKVQAQLRELQAMGVADDETFTVLEQIMLTGHDGAHPHLPALSEARAAVLLQLMKDVLYQIYVRPAKIREASQLRKQASQQ